jgi:peptidoglycan hydrolase-like protein with peptidoglycan-binding domain
VFHVLIYLGRFQIYKNMRHIQLFEQFILEAASTLYREGSKGPEVSAIQTVVQAPVAGGDEGKNKTFGPMTKKAVVAWQKANGLDADGIVGPMTLKKMSEVKGMGKWTASMIAKMAASGGTTPAPSGGTPAAKGESPAAAASPISSFGKFTPAGSKTAPLVVVFGGIPVGGRQSGDYMYDYFNKTGSKYNLFVANTHKVDGAGAYDSLKGSLSKDGISPSKKILYLFSGGYRPGMTLLQKVGAGEFDKIYLVDIWMGNSAVADFYKKLAAENKDKVEYYYTQGGSVNPPAAKEIAGSVTKKAEGTQGHMATNVDAVKSLETYA